MSVPGARLDAVGVHNSVLQKANARLDALEEKLAELLLPILEKAGDRAATEFRKRATNHLLASAGREALTAAGPGVTSASTMVALKPRPEEAARIAQVDGLDADTLHVTLAYLGEIDGDLAPVVDALRPVAASYAPLRGVVAGIGIFGEGGGGPTILLPDVPGLVELRVAATEALAAAGVTYARDHGFQAHVTVDYYDDADADVELGRAPLREPLHFDAILVVRGDVIEAEIPLVGVPAVTAAGEPPGWTAPFGDEIVDVDSLVATLRTKTDPVRRALIEAAMTPGLRDAGIAFDITNPFTRKVLGQAGAHVTNIAETTRLNVMRTIRAAYDEGLTIPDTALAIQAGMAAAAPARARMIARTELAGAVNGGSLAAAQIVADATKATYRKRWLTAPGAKYPRHEDYPDLDGQEASLDSYFEVGGARLHFPGDPEGDPGETINCRCTLVYDEGDADVATEEGLPAGTPDDQALVADFGPRDAISVGAGPTLPASVVEKIQRLGLDTWPPRKSAAADEIFGAATDTTGLFKQAGEWTAERKDLHDKIVAAHFEGKVVPTEGTPTTYFTAGGGASGKSGAIFDVDGRELTLDELGARKDVVWIDPDRVKEMLPEYKTLRSRNDFYAASGVHEESSEIAKRITEEAHRRGFSTIVDTTGSSEGFVRKLEAAAAAGRDVKVTMFSIPTNEAIARAIARGDRSGRYVAIEALKKAHAGASRQLGVWKDSPVVQEWRVYDNTGGSPELVAEGVGGAAKVYEPEKFNAILAKANER